MDTSSTENSGLVAKRPLISLLRKLLLFSDGRRLGEALIDARGNAFLSNGNNQGEYVILAPPGPPPHTALSKVPSSEGNSAATVEDRIAVRLTTDASTVEGKIKFSWRLDGGPWTTLTADGPAAVVTLDGLPGGMHQMEARSFDPAMQTDPTPARLTFEIHLDPQAQVTGYIVQLGDPDYSHRKMAVAALARQPEMAMPALRAARVTAADDNQRWWIDAALQQIETTKRGIP